MSQKNVPASSIQVLFARLQLIRSHLTNLQIKTLLRNVIKMDLNLCQAKKVVEPNDPPGSHFHKSLKPSPIADFKCPQMWTVARLDINFIRCILSPDVQRCYSLMVRNWIFYGNFNKNIVSDPQMLVVRCLLQSICPCPCIMMYYTPVLQVSPTNCGENYIKRKIDKHMS